MKFGTINWINFTISPKLENVVLESLNTSMPQSPDTLREIASLLNLSEKLYVVDIGANPIGPPPPYQHLIAAGLVKLTGFEPQTESFKTLKDRKNPNEEYLPYAVGDGEEHTLNIYKGSGFTSLFRLRKKTMNVFRGISRFERLLFEEKLQTQRLDDISAVQKIDFLKIDIQGGELAVFQSGKKKLHSALAIQTEVAFFPLYEEQPMFGDVDVFLRSIGFIFHRFVHIAKFPLGEMVVRGRRRKPMHQALDGDVIYVRDFSDTESMSDIDIAKLALISHSCFESYDLAALLISQLENRGFVDEESTNAYANLLPTDFNLEEF